MKIHDIVFYINPTTYISIPLKDSIEEVHTCYEEDIILSLNTIKILISDGPILYNIQQLIIQLKKALKNRLQLHKSIIQNIGHLCNEYYNDETGFIEKKFNNQSLWVGYEYLVWEVCRKNIGTTTWIYNDKNGAIVLEITPDYPYFFCEPEEEPNYIPYKEWIKTYKPYFVTTLSKETAQQWLKQAEHIIKIVDDNQKKWDQAKDKEMKS